MAGDPARGFQAEMTGLAAADVAAYPGFGRPGCARPRCSSYGRETPHGMRRRTLPSGVTPTGDEGLAFAREDLADAVLDAFGLDVPICVTVELADGVAERVLVDRSADADLLVLGASSLSGHEGWPAGPVVRACLAHSRFPSSSSARAARPRAQLLVIGARGRGGLPEMRLGSVSFAVLHHAPCTVSIIREG